MSEQKRVTSEKKARKQKRPTEQEHLEYLESRRIENQPGAKHPVLVHGYTVQFPFPNPYQPQLAIMSNVLKSLNKTLPNNGISSRSVAIIESPTGTGKTLALLTAALEWQTQVKLAGGIEAYSIQTSKCDSETQTSESSPSTTTPDTPTKQSSTQSDVQIVGCTITPPKERSRHGSSLLGEGQKSPDALKIDLQPPANRNKRKSPESGEQTTTTEATPPTTPNSDKRIEKTPPSKRQKRPLAPKIYYTSRTHAQIKKAIGELRLTAYRPVISVLASREHYCINTTVQKSAMKDQECKALISTDPPTCKLKRNVDKLTNSSLLYPPNGELQLWDIEDLVHVGTKENSCPYFAARNMAETAELVFCPYNYIIDPIIRHAMSIDLSDSIVIIDEAHNVEDVARESASYEFEYADLYVAITELQACKARFAALDSTSSNAENYAASAQTPQQIATIMGWLDPVLSVLTKFENWLTQVADAQLQRTDFESYTNVWKGNSLASLLKELNITEEYGPFLVKCVWKGMEAFASSQLEQLQLLSLKTLILIEKFGYLVHFLTLENMKYVEDYILLVEKAPRMEGGRKEWCTRICWWALSGAVAFRPILSSIRSLVLVSGTLAPFAALRSELGIDDPVIQTGFTSAPVVSCLSTPHVINTASQLLVLRLPSATIDSTVVPLKLDYKSQDRVDVQDSVAEVLLQVATNVPGGVLVCFPSYAMMEKFARRWKTTQVWHRLNQLKPIYCESKSATNAEFRSILSMYHASVNSGRGAIFLAVCRGKLSEGMDFQDALARAVVIVGIPYPFVKDLKVVLKKEYNAEKSVKNNALLSGSAWYTLQAFRALNQAVGRIIRHSRDFGAVVLIDSRFTEPNNVAQLSSWVRRSLGAPVTDIKAMGAQLRQFFTRHGVITSTEDVSK